MDEGGGERECVCVWWKKAERDSERDREKGSEKEIEIFIVY